MIITNIGVSEKIPLSTVITINDVTYTRSALTPTPTITCGDKTLVKDTDFTCSYSNNINAGTATCTITGIGKYTGTISKNFTINKANSSITLSTNSITVSASGTSTFTITAQTGDGTLSVSSSATSYITASMSGATVTCTGIAAGSATITVYKAATSNYNATSASVSATCSSKLYLYNEGDECTSITGGWLYEKLTYSPYQSYSESSATKNSANLYTNMTYNIMYCDNLWWYTTNGIDFSNYSKLNITWTVEFKATGTHTNDNDGVYVSAKNASSTNAPGPGTGTWSYVKASGSTPITKTYTETWSCNTSVFTSNNVRLNIGATTGYQQNIYVTINKVWLE